MKQILLINDVVGHSHVGMTAMLPILTYQGHATFNLPTALVSNTLDYGHFNILETTNYMRETIPVWQRLGFYFDAVCTGLMFSEEQAKLVADYCQGLRKNGTTLFVDPIMGDGGRLYNGIEQRQVELMRSMVALADLTFPNLTEACLLADRPFSDEGFTLQGIRKLMDDIASLGARAVVITSAKVDGRHCVVGYRREEGDYFKLDYEEIPVAFHGTGDIFSAVLIGHLLNGHTLQDSTRRAMQVVSSLISHNRDLPDKMEGIPIERCLNLL